MPIGNQAHALLASLWMNPKFTLRFGMVESVPSDEAQAALDQLCEAGVLQAKSEPSGAVVYSLTSYGKQWDRRPPGETDEDRMDFVREHGRFPMVKPK